MIVVGVHHCPEGREPRIRRAGGTTALRVKSKRGVSRRQFLGALQFRHAIVRAVKAMGVWSALPRNPIGIANCGPKPSFHDTRSRAAGTSGLSDAQSSASCDRMGARSGQSFNVVPDVALGCAPCKGGAFQWVRIPPGEMLQPEATGAVMEVTKWLIALG